MSASSLLLKLNYTRDLAYNLLELEFHQIDMHGLAPSHAEIILFLQSGGRKTMQEIARHIQRDKSTLTVLINKLERKGFVKRVPGLADRRKTYIEPQASCAIVEKEIKKIYNKVNRLLVKDLSASDKKSLAKLLEICRGSLLEQETS